MPLSTNWRRTANYYISDKDGLDSNSGTSQALPKKTLGNALTNLNASNLNYLVRTGYYLPTASYYNNNITGSPVNIIGDGRPVIDGSATAILFQTNGASGFNFFVDNFIILNATNVLNATQNILSFKNCNVFNSPVFRVTMAQNCLFVNSNVIRQGTATSPDIGLLATYRCTFINCPITYGSVGAPLIHYTRCAFDTNSSWTRAVASTFDNCAFGTGGANDFRINSVNIRNATITGDPNPIGTQYADGQKFSGTATIGGQTITFTNCFWTDNMGFNSTANGDYTLKVSPLSPLHNAGLLIGCFGTYVRFDATHSAFNPVNSGVVIPANITVSGGTFQLTSGTEATIVSTDNPAQALALPYYTYLNNIVQFFGAFNYPNGDWIDKANYQAGVNDEVRLTYRLRIYNELTSSWGSWFDLETFTAGTYDATGKGNGDVDAVMTSMNSLLGKIFQIEMTLRNNGI